MIKTIVISIIFVATGYSIWSLITTQKRYSNDKK